MKRRQIEPRPTQYRNILFRSKLEARTAVLLDNIPNVLSWKYEPKSFKLPAKGWEYTPDFGIVYYLRGVKNQCLFEVKPNAPSEQYLTYLQSFNFKQPLLFFMPDYFHRYYGCFILNRRGKEAYQPSCDFDEFDVAFARAAAYRFDLQ